MYVVQNMGVLLGIADSISEAKQLYAEAYGRDLKDLEHVTSWEYFIRPLPECHGRLHIYLPFLPKLPYTCFKKPVTLSG